MFESLFPKIFVCFVVLLLVYILIQFIRGNPNCGITIGKIYTPFGSKKWTLWGNGKMEKIETGLLKKKHKKH